MCEFCAHPETIEHLFFHCHFAKFLWRAVQVTFNIDSPTSVEHLFSAWANGVGIQLKQFILIGAFALC
jgi:hypothetical protein